MPAFRSDQYLYHNFNADSVLSVPSPILQVVELCDALIAATQSNLTQASDQGAVSALLAILAAAYDLKAVALGQQRKQIAAADTDSNDADMAAAQLIAMAETVLELVGQHPAEFCIVQAAATVVQLAADAGKQLDAHALQVVACPPAGWPLISTLAS